MCTPLPDYGPCDDSSAPYVKEIAQRAVDEHNSKEGTKYTLAAVVKCESRVVGGTNYRLVLTLNDDTTTGDFSVEVYYTPWDDHIDVIEFKPVNK
ncbi:Cysteine proteinase inhibitor 1 [Cucumis melo var. makuwa]|uniref:Cysteine proteinase inhibitor 1 n=2 Tax=Cucumis melo TaxID=3656 RepID=A0A5A7SH83_CUCMM|nr:Cysteine proteinase inhibitor 1 [Cucumis melo var. makuwa]TYK07470.1 Cysteine proteinase inhibitor 1 [Cucumis melo var. makuwa]